MLLMDFRRHPKPFVWAELYSVRPVKPVSPRSLIVVIVNIEIETGRILLRRLLRVTTSDVD